MQIRIIALLAVLLLLSGCQKRFDESDPSLATEEVTEHTVQTQATEPPRQMEDPQIAGAVVARVGDVELTNLELQIWYWAEVAQYRQSDHDVAPDFDRPLDSQACGIDHEVSSWQDYFLREAVDTWYGAHALMLHSADVPLNHGRTYNPNEELHETYMKDMPAAAYLLKEYYAPNSQHQAYLDALSDVLLNVATEKGYGDLSIMARNAFGSSQDALMACVDAWNRGYMYFTELTYGIEPIDAELLAYYEANNATFAEGGTYVDIRHILLIPQKGDWVLCEQQAEALVESWRSDRRCSEATFRELAVKHSQDAGTALDGGIYCGITEGQLIQPLGAWCFDSVRQIGDVGIIRSELGVHILYYAGGGTLAYAESVEAYTRSLQETIILQAKEAYPVEIILSAAALDSAEATVSLGDMLYPDIAHERFSEIPLYLQQDYPGVSYGSYWVSSHGCGITSMAMLASYMSDKELTPAYMSARYKGYVQPTGTDGMMFYNEPSSMGFYLREITGDATKAKAALEEGQLVISLQGTGYWTREGHYILCCEIIQDDLVRVRDSNIYNYGRKPAHKQDLHPWKTVVQGGCGFWIYEDKITYIPACSRCGTDEDITQTLLTREYLCEKCQPALLRRDTYLGN